MQEIICILDASGSMGYVEMQAIEGFNKFLIDQKAIGEANLTIIWFDDKYEVAYEGLLSEAALLTHWKVQGMTALYDAIGKTFARVKERFTAEKPEKVILVVQTDGQENASMEFSGNDINKLITEHEQKYAWEVIFMGAGLSSINTAKTIGIRSVNAINYEIHDTYDAFSGVYSNTVASYRT